MFVVNMPPSPNEVMFLTSWKLNAVKSAIVPIFLPLYSAPNACAASSSTMQSCLRASSMIGSRSAGYPPISTGTIILVLAVIFFSTSCGSMLSVIGSTSANTSLQPIESG